MLANMFSPLHFIRVAQAGVIAAPKPPGYDTPDDLVGQACNAASWLFGGAIILSIVFVLIAAITYMRSSGDPAKVKEATNMLMYAAIGVAVALVAFLFPGIIAEAMNVTGLGKVC